MVDGAIMNLVWRERKLYYHVYPGGKKEVERGRSGGKDMNYYPEI